MKVWPDDARGKRRLKILLLILFALLPVAIIRVHHMRVIARENYGTTWSLGHRIGCIMYGDPYYRLPTYLKRAVEVHENYHLEHGTLGDDTESEHAAYDAEIAYEKEIRAYYFRLWLDTGNDDYIVICRNIEAFMDEAIFARESYK